MTRSRREERGAASFGELGAPSGASWTCGPGSAGRDEGTIGLQTAVEAQEQSQQAEVTWGWGGAEEADESCLGRTPDP